MPLSRDIAADLAKLNAIGPGRWQPTPAELAAAPSIDRYWVGTCGHGEILLFGTIMGHPTVRNGLSLTSTLIATDTMAGWVRTRNRYYRIGDHGQNFSADLGARHGTSA